MNDDGATRTGFLSGFHAHCDQVSASFEIRTTQFKAAGDLVVVSTVAGAVGGSSEPRTESIGALTSAASSSPSLLSHKQDGGLPCRHLLGCKGNE